jgi:uncharacterized protein YrzB (UPF0473 family)
LEQDREFITLIDDNGDELDFELVVIVEVDGEQYKVLIPEDEIDLEESEAIVVKVGYDEIGEEIYESVG